MSGAMNELNHPSIGAIGMGLVGSAVMKMTAADRGWDIDPSRCVNAQGAQDVFQHSDFIFLCLPDSDVACEVLRAATLRPGRILIDTSTGDLRAMAALGAEMAA